MHHHHHHRSHRHYGCCPPGGCSSILSHCNPQSGARTRPSRGAAKVSMQPRRRQKGQTSRSFARSLSPRWLSMGCLYPGAERKPKFGVRTLSERGKLNKSLSENFIKASWWHFANARFHLRLAQVKNSNQGKDTHQHSSKEFIRETWAMRWKWRLSFMLHTNLNTWHAQNESCGKHWEWERGKMVGNPGIQTVKNPAHLTSPTSKMRCCYPFPLLAAAHKSHSSPCLQDVCHVYCCHSLSLSPSLSDSYPLQTSQQKTLLETKTSKNIFPFLVVAKSLLCACWYMYYVFGFERFCLLYICLAFSCTACWKKWKSEAKRRSKTSWPIIGTEIYKGAWPPPKLGFSALFSSFVIGITFAIGALSLRSSVR